MHYALRTGLLASLIVFCSAHAEIPIELQAKVQAIVNEELKAAGTPAMSVAVVADGRVAALFAAGFADIENKVPATTETRFQAASLTKLLTATLVMHEVEAGRLSLDAHVNDSLPPARQVRDTKGRTTPITLRHLLSHSSGIPFGSSIQLDPNEQPRTLDEQLAEGPITMRQPGVQITYASKGYALAGWLAAQAQDMPFEALAERALLAPLGMTRSGFNPPREYGPELAAAYDGNARIPNVTVSAGMPSGALITTADDLARFALLCLARGEFNGTRIIKSESVDEMLRLSVRIHPRIPEGMGFGFGVREVPGRKYVWWDGQLPGAASRLALLPEHRVGVIVLANRADNSAVNRVANRILELLVPSQPLARLPAQSEKAEAHALAGAYRLTGMLAPPRSLIERFINIKISESNEGLTLTSILANEPSTIVPLGSGTFQTADGSYGLVEGDRLYFTLIQAQRVAWWQSATAWFVYVGAFVVALLGLLGWGAFRLFRRRVSGRKH